MTDPKTDVWMPLWIGSYLADTMKLTTVQHGAYFLLLMAYWRERSPLKDSDDELRSITKTDRAEWKKMRPVIAEFFKVADGVWWHKRVEQEMAAADERSKKAKEKAQKGADARWKDRPKDATGDAPSIPQALPEDKPNQCPPPSPLPTELRSVKKSASAPDPACPVDVPETVWADWLALRKKKRAPVTDTVISGARAEAEKAAMPLAEFLAVWCTRGSQGLQAEWLTSGKSGQSTEPAWRKDARKRMQEAVPSIAEKSGPPAHEFFELEAKNVTPSALGR